MITQLPLQGLELQALLYIYRGKGNHWISDIKLKFGSANGNIVQALTSLSEQGYLSLILDKKDCELTEKGWFFFNAYNKIGNSYIHENQLDHAIMLFLSQLKVGISKEFFPSVILDKAFIESPTLANSQSLHDYMHHNSKLKYCYTETGLLSDHGKDYFEDHLDKKEKESEKQSLEFQHLKDSIEQLEMKLKDYPLVRKQKIWAFIISIIAIGIAAISLLLQILKS
jgi:DNA-binding MarR family transcriptional regulator